MNISEDARPDVFVGNPPPSKVENKHHHLLGHAVDYRRRNWTWAWGSLTNLTQAGPSKNCRGIFEIVTLECYQLPGKTACSKKFFLVLLFICWKIKAACIRGRDDSLKIWIYMPIEIRECQGWGPSFLISVQKKIYRFDSTTIKHFPVDRIYRAKSQRYYLFFETKSQATVSCLKCNGLVTVVIMHTKPLMKSCKQLLVPVSIVTNASAYSLRPKLLVVLAFLDSCTLRCT